MSRIARGVLVAVLLGSPPSFCLAQVFVKDLGSLPGGHGSYGYPYQVDLGDLDGDGDPDVGVANFGNGNGGQSRLWVNSGGLQGGTAGVFSDETSVRFPSALEATRELDFADLDGDGDLDVVTSA